MLGAVLVPNHTLVFYKKSIIISRTITLSLYSPIFWLKKKEKRQWLSYGKKVTQCLQSTNVFRQKYLKTSYQKEERVKL